MKKYLKFIITLVLVLFIFNLNVKAEICDDSDTFIKSGSSAYCQSKTNLYTYYDSVTNNQNHVVSLYKISSNNKYLGNTEYAMCLDPGFNSPTTKTTRPYTYYRSLNNFSCDSDFYKVYQYFVNDVAYAKTTLNNTFYLEQANVALRVLAVDDGCALVTDIMNKNSYYSGFHKHIYKQFSGIDSNAGSSTSIVKSIYNNSPINRYKTFYNTVKNGGFLWNNPLKITPSWEYDNENNKYVFNFEIKFTNETSQYFNSNDSGLYSGDYDIGDGHAYFKYQLLINNGAYDIAGNTISGTPGEFCISTVNNIKECEKTVYILENPNSTRNIKLEMSKDTYDSIVNQTGKVTISLNYSTYHPMAEDNVVLNYVGESDVAEYLYQRMVIFSKVSNSGTINADGSLSENVNYCRQDGNNFYYGNSNLNLVTYKAKCGCSNINSNSLTNNNFKKIYSELCPTVSSSTYSSTLSDCTKETEVGKNKLTHSTKNSLNTYCTLSCDETVDVNNMVGNFSTEAGKTFKFEKYPSLTANKECKVDVKHSSWHSDYNALLNQEIYAYNEYVKSEAIKNPSSSSVSCSCGKDCTTYRDVYRASYPVYYLRGDSILSETKNVSWGGCGGTSAPSITSNAYSKFIDNYDKLMNHFKQLKTCNSYLNKLGSEVVADDRTFYNFGANLQFYYEQTISDKSNGQYKAKVVRNDSKENNVDDSSFNSKLLEANSSGNYKEFDTDSGNINEYVYISNDGNTNGKYYTGKNNVNNDYEIVRNVSYKYKYSPSVEKYVDTYTNIISSNSNSLKNPVYLGYVYDTDVAALAKKDNKTLYAFMSVGEKGSKGQTTDSIYDYFIANDKSKLERTCTYEITNDIIVCNDSSCTTEPEKIKNEDPVNPSSNIAFRIVDSNNVDPNNRLGSKGFKNWNNEKGKTVKNAIEESDTFNPDNLEYSFTLDSATIQSIRKYNKNKSYSNVNSEKIDGVGSLLECENGTKCLSSFITAASDGNTVLFDKKFALNTNGRTTWKVYENKDGKNYIDGKEIRDK